jgi:hypothetical protein
MTTRDPNVDSVELVVEELGDLVSELVLVGGCAVGLLITDKARPTVRQTKDVDLVAEIVTLGNYHKLESKLRSRGFTNGSDGVICRWQKGALLVDVMPIKELGFGSTNRWYPLVVKYAAPYRLPRGGEIRVIPAPLFIAAKFDAFHSRGEGDYEHHDIEDIVNVVDGREELAAEIEQSEDAIKTYIQEECEDLLANREFTERLAWYLNPDEANQRRAPMLLKRFRDLAGL